MEEIRTFIAIELDAPIQRALIRIQDSLRRDLPAQAVRWVNPSGIHLTLKFLGNVPASRIAGVGQALEQACAGFAPFDLAVGGLGCFPGYSRPNVVWVGLGGDVETLRRLRDSVEQYVAPLGYPTEGRDFKAHLTLGRVKNASPAEGREVGDVVRNTRLDVIGTLRAAEVSLMRSELSRQGARYTQLAAVPLAEP